MSQGNGSSKHFVPSGVDAQSWIGFEQRIQERRFKALLETITNAVAQRDGVAARVALEEARELRPCAPELEMLAARVALLPTGTVSAEASAAAWYRGLGAVAMFVVGIGLVIGIESMRSGTQATAVDAVASAARDSVAAGAPLEMPAKTMAAPIAIMPAVDATPVETPVVPQISQPLAVARPIVEPTREEPVGTAGASHAAGAAAAAPNRETFRAPEADVEPLVSTSREIPDDYVAPSPRSEGRAGYVEAAPSASSIAANVMPQPISITAPPPVLPASNRAIATPSTVAPGNDNSRVAQVLQQYARAYDRLDPGAARSVWPTVDERALARAFASLESQSVSFENCDIEVKGSEANASCRGTASYVGKVGSRQARTEPRQWTFELKLHGDDWKIEKAQALAR